MKQTTSFPSFICVIFYIIFFIFKNEKTGIAEIKEGITGEAGERRKQLNYKHHAAGLSQFSTELAALFS